MKTFIALFISLFISFAQAKTATSEGTLKKINKFFSKEENYFQTSMSFGMGSFSRGKKFDHSYSANQTNLEAGVTIGLPIQDFATSTLFGFSLINFKDEDILKGKKGLGSGSSSNKHNAREFSIRQRVHYNLVIKAIPLRPFLELGWGFGDYDYQISNNAAKSEIEVDSGYTRMIVGIGAQAEYKKILPFLKVELANISYSGSSEVSTKTGSVVKNSSPSTPTDLEDGNSFIVSTGVGYKF